MSLPPLRHIMLSRTDNLGDCILTLPMAGFLKERFPGVRVSFLGQAYTEPVLQLCEHVDEVIDFHRVSANLSQFFREAKPDAIVHVFPRTEIAKAAWSADIPLRIGTRNRLYHWFYCNQKPPVSRNHSPLHEALLNLKLLERLTDVPNFSERELASYLGCTRVPPLGNVAQFLRPGCFQLVLHPKSKGSAREWPVAHFVELVRRLPPSVHILVTGSEAERPFVTDLLAEPRVVDLTGRTSLSELLGLLAKVDGLIAASTGPLHMAAALGRRALGLYPPIHPMHGERWGPIGEKAEWITAGKPGCDRCRSGGDCVCVASILPHRVADVVERWLQESRS